MFDSLLFLLSKFSDSLLEGAKLCVAEKQKGCFCAGCALDAVGVVAAGMLSLKAGKGCSFVFVCVRFV